MGILSSDACQVPSCSFRFSSLDFQATEIKLMQAAVVVRAFTILVGPGPFSDDSVCTPYCTEELFNPPGHHDYRLVCGPLVPCRRLAPSNRHLF
jgi:hypothetical protein